jgi:asparagine synthetase B (glutamine-hydrolysing)
MAGMFGIVELDSVDNLHEKLLKRLRTPGPTCERSVFFDGFEGIAGIVRPARLKDFDSSLHVSELGFAICDGDVYEYCGNKLERPLEFLLAAFCSKKIEDFSSYFQDINGSFSLAFFDKRRALLALVSDKRGTAPLFYCFLGEGLAWSSNLWALSAVTGVSEIDPIHLAQKLAFNISFDGSTWLNNISKLRHGKAVLFDLVNKSGKVINSSWHCPCEPLRDRKSTLSFAPGFFAERFGRLVSDTQSAMIALSGGLDSRVLLACLKNSGCKISTFTYGDETSVDAVIAHEICKRVGVANVFLDFGSLLRENYVQMAKETIRYSNGLHGANRSGQAYIYKKLASRQDSADVVLTGVSGDCLFRGQIGPDNYIAKNIKDIFRGTPNLHYHLKQYESLLQPEFHSIYSEVIHERIRNLSDELGDLTSPRAHLEYMASYMAPQYFGGELSVARQYFKYRAPFWDSRIVDFAFETELSTVSMSRLAKKSRMYFGKLHDSLKESELWCRVIHANLPELGFLTYDRISPSLLSSGGMVLGEINALRHSISRVFKKPSGASQENCGEWYRTSLNEWVSELLVKKPLNLTQFFKESALAQLYKQHSVRERDHSNLLGHLITCRLALDCLASDCQL